MGANDLQRARPAQVGDRRTVPLVDNLGRTQIVMYAGASGDFNPVHTDEVYATTRAGYPTVFAHGMLTMGMTGTVLTDWFGSGSVMSYRARFKGIVFPGDTLTATAEVTSIDSVEGVDVATLEVNTVNQKGEVVLAASARVALSAWGDSA